MDSVRTFDPGKHMRKIKTRNGLQDYLDVKYRVAWIRAEYPAAQIITTQIEGSDTHARFQCLITLPNGAIGSGHGSETQQDFPDFYEKAETKAIGRACAVLGYGTDMAADLDDGEPLDGLPAAKSERAARREEPTPISEAQKQAIEVRHVYGEVLDAAGRVGVPIREGDKFADMARKIVEKKGPEPKYVTGDAVASYREVLASLKQMADR